MTPWTRSSNATRQLIYHPIDDPTENPLVQNYVIARARANGNNNTWEGRDLSAFNQVYQAVAEELCFDESRVFGVGNEGGGRFLIRLCEVPTEGMVGPSIFSALTLVGFHHAPCDSWPDVPLLFLHSIETAGATGDEDGQKALGYFREAKGCELTPTPSGSWPSGAGLTYTCEDYEGCSSPLRFCSWDLPIDSHDIWLREHNEHLARFFADYH